MKSQVFADFIVDGIGPLSSNHLVAKIVWTIHCDSAWCHAGAGTTTIITAPSCAKYKYAARLCFALEIDICTNNIAGYEVVIFGLRKLRALGVRTCIVKTNSKVVDGPREKYYAAREPVLLQYLSAV